MARRRGGDSDEQGGSWLDTYGDMITLVLTFFVLLYSMSSISQEKFQYIAQAFSSMGNVINAVVAGEVKVDEPLGNLVEEAQLNAGETPQNFDQLYQYLKQYVEENNLSQSVEVTKGAANVFLKFRDNVFFNPDSDVLRQEGKDILTGISGGIKAVDKYILGIRVNGYTAEAENSTVNDRDLSTGRANAVLKYLEALNIVENAKYSASGYGKYRPVAPNDTEENRRLNRRVEIIIARNDVDYSNPDVIKEFFEVEYGTNFVVPSGDESLGPKSSETSTDASNAASGTDSGTSQNSSPNESTGNESSSNG
jgi:chemotaxis protein MotB